MRPLLFSHLRSGIMALGLIAGLSPAMAGPAPIAAQSILPSVGGQASLDGSAVVDGTVTTIADRRWVRRGGGGGNWHNGGGGHWNNGGGGHWNNGGGGNWNHGPRRNWNNNWRPRPYYPNWNGGVYGGWGGFWGPQVYLQLGQPYYPNGQYYAPPRRVYRGDILLSANHVQWCYNRWRSYRSSDNTYQPNHGPRRLCVSPYS